LTNSRFATDAQYRERIIQANNKLNIEQTVSLSSSELSILYWSAQGKTAEEVATILGLTKNTVDTYRRNLLDKLDVSNITQAVHVASTMGLIV
jgi:DNA-binding CsgD family transcriptional regulator